MELLAILFVLGIFIFLNSPKKPPKQTDPWEDMGKAIGKALNTLCKEQKPPESKSSSPKSNDLFWVILFSAFIGTLFLFGP